MLDKAGKNLMGSSKEPSSEVANKAIGAYKTIKVNTKGKVLCDEMREKVGQVLKVL